jgi:hypothetical protein
MSRVSHCLACTVADFPRSIPTTVFEVPPENFEEVLQASLATGRFTRVTSLLDYRGVDVLRAPGIKDLPHYRYAYLDESTAVYKVSVGRDPEADTDRLVVERTVNGKSEFLDVGTMSELF